MRTSIHFPPMLGRAIIIGSLACSVLGEGVASAAPAITVTPSDTTGTIVGSVACGPTDQPPGAQTMVGVAGTDLTTRSDNNGAFSLQVPASQLLTVQAVASSPDVLASVPNISVGAGQTLDIGPLDLAVCPQPAIAPADNSQDEVNVEDQGGASD